MLLQTHFIWLVVAHLGRIQHSGRPEDAWTLFDSLNLDGNNVLTLEEFIKFASASFVCLVLFVCFRDFVRCLFHSLLFCNRFV